jgi:flagellar motor component MotA
MTKESDSQLLVRIDERVKTIFETHPNKEEVRDSLDATMEKHVKALHQGISWKGVIKILAIILPSLGVIGAAIRGLFF